MRRSVRDAIVGFTLIGGIIGFASTALWLRGVRLGSSHWSLTARFNDAAGLAERSPVTYRGILVGSVRSIVVTPEAVVAELEINQADLRLPLPVTATVGSASLLGGAPGWRWSVAEPRFRRMHPSLKRLAVSPRYNSAAVELLWGKRSQAFPP